MPHFEQNDRLNIENQTIIFKEYIGTAGNSDVYKVINNDKKKYMALKHMYGYYSTNPQLFYRNLKHLCQLESPHTSLVWPYSVGTYNHDTQSFVYLMELLPPDYKPLVSVMKDKDRGQITENQRRMIAIKITDVFATLHKKGFIYCDISGRNIVYKINQDGAVDVKVINCDNISFDGLTLGLRGTGLFRSPELFLGGNPSFQSDAHALAVIIFWLFVGTHPLDGKLTRSKPFTIDLVKESFGDNPVYIFEKNSINPPIHDRYLQRFNSLSPQLQMYFNLMFCQSSLHNSQHRPDLEILYKILTEEDHV